MHIKIRWILLISVVFFTLMSIDRIYLLSITGYLTNINTGVLNTLWLGARYDLRETGILALFMMLLSFVPFLNPFKSGFGKKFWLWLLSILTVLVVFIYVADTLHYDYLTQRLNASVLNFLPEGNTSLEMVWQTYPVIKLTIFIALVSAITIFFIRKSFNIKSGSTAPIPKVRNILSFVALFLLCAFCIFGRLDQYPLRWSDAFGLRDSRLSQLALNPFQSFVSSLRFRHVSYDEKASRQYYPLMAQYLGVDSSKTSSTRFLRTVSGDNVPKTNIVLVICESFSAYKSSMWGNPLQTTPFFNSMCKDGIFFDHCFTPHFGTARGVWATITGIPDVLLDKTASRNPLIVDQHSIFNDFKGFEKDYFIGGSTSWANIKGVLENNIEGITIHEQGSYDAKKIDVWGISDKNLFLQANKVLSKKTAPFFAIIQTSDNHRPYTIPAEDKDAFKTVSFPSDSLNMYGFQSNEELNAFRYTDFSYQVFIEAAKKEKYFANTIFIFIGDHGIRGNAGNMFPKAWTENALTCFHVPLLFYAPGRLKAERHSMLSSQVDVMPTIAGLAGIPYTNTTMGRDLLHLKDTTSNTVFLIDHDVRNIAILHGKYLFQRHLETKQEALVPINDNETIPKENSEELTRYMRDLTIGFYENARYMLFNNAKAKK